MKRRLGLANCNKIIKHIYLSMERLSYPMSPIRQWTFQHNYNKGNLLINYSESKVFFCFVFYFFVGVCMFEHYRIFMLRTCAWNLNAVRITHTTDLFWWVTVVLPSCLFGTSLFSAVTINLIQYYLTTIRICVSVRCAHRTATWNWLTANHGCI